MDVLSTALMWRSLGIATMPCLYRSKSPALNQWKPYQTRLPTEFELRAWFSNPGYNLAVITGWRGLVIVDFDSSAAWDRFVSMSFDVPLTYEVLTPRGRHLYFYCTEATQCASLDGIDIKAGGGYCLAPPSIHPSGQAYISAISSDEIVYLESITDILPEYQQAISKPPPCPQASPTQRGASTLDPLDAAWLPHTSITIEEASAKLSYRQLLGPCHHAAYYICPFHDDHEPSLLAYPDGDWRCFGCGAYGDILDLYAKLNGMTIREALCTF